MYNNSPQNADALIYSALFRVQLQDTYFASLNNPRTDSDIEGLRNEFAIARRTILSQFTGSWCDRRIEITEENPNDPGWYRAPSDLIAWREPNPIGSKYGMDGIPLFRFNCYSSGKIWICYIYDREDMANCPPAIIEVTKWHFLHNIATQCIFDSSRIALIRERLLAAENIAAKEAACDKHNQMPKYRNWGYNWRWR